MRICYLLWSLFAVNCLILTNCSEKACNTLSHSNLSVYQSVLLAKLLCFPSTRKKVFGTELMMWTWGFILDLIIQMCSLSSEDPYKTKQENVLTEQRQGGGRKGLSVKIFWEHLGCRQGKKVNVPYTFEYRIFILVGWDLFWTFNRRQHSIINVCCPKKLKI